MKKYHDKGAKNLPKLVDGQAVYFEHKGESSVDPGKSERTYLIEGENGEGRPSVIRDSVQSVFLPYTSWLVGQSLSGERQRTASGKALDNSAIRAGPQW